MKTITNLAIIATCSILGAVAGVAVVHFVVKPLHARRVTKAADQLMKAHELHTDLKNELEGAGLTVENRVTLTKLLDQLSRVLQTGSAVLIGSTMRDVNTLRAGLAV